MERKDRDLQTILSEDGKSSLMFDKARAEEHRTERATAFDHGHIVAIWKTEFNNYVRCIEAATATIIIGSRYPRAVHTFISLNVDFIISSPIASSKRFSSRRGVVARPGANR